MGGVLESGCPEIRDGGFILCLAFGTVHRSENGRRLYIQVEVHSRPFWIPHMPEERLEEL